MVGTQQFNLRWNNHTSNILQVFLEHLSSESLVDVTLSCEGKFIRAHKIILSACSPYFQEVFANHTDKQPLIILNGVRFEDLQSMIKFMYNGEIRVQEVELEALLAAAETLQVKGLSNVRSKYERGEITSLAPAAQKVAPKTSEPSALTKQPPPVHSIKTTVGVFLPTATTTRAPSTGAAGLAVPTPANVAARVSSKFSSKAVGIAARPPGAPVPALAMATTVPAVPPPTIPGVSCVSNTLRTVVPTFPRPTTANASTMTSTTGITFSAVSAMSTGTTTMASSVIPITFTTSSIDATGVGSEIGRVKSVGTIGTINEGATRGKKNFVQGKSNCNPVTEISRVPGTLTSASSTTAIVDKEAEKKPAEPQAPRVRKRRKMSHIVNELARETVFASNGTVLLEPDESVLRKMKKNSVTVRTDLSDSAEIEGITVPSETKKLRVKIQSKHPQESLLIKDKEKETREMTKIPRPPNAFMIFANEWRRKLAAEYPTESNTKISVRLGIMWKGLSIKSKETFYRLARTADEEHKQKYPGYFYSPKEARLKKNLRHDQILTKYLSTSSKEKSSSDRQDLDELAMIRAYMSSEERTNNDDTYSSESDDDYGDEEGEEEEEYDYYGEEEDDMILEYSGDEDEADVKPDLSMLSAKTTHPSKLLP